MMEYIIQYLVVIILAGIATYDTLQSRRKNTGETSEKPGIFDIVR